MGEILSRAGAARPAGKERLAIVVELDDRSFLFPAGVGVTHLNVNSLPNRRIAIEAVPSFNAARHDPRLAVLSLDDGSEFARKCIDSYYQGRTQHVLSEAIKIAVIFNPNGFLIQFQREGDEALELFITAGSLMRLAQGLLRVLDDIAPVAAH